MRYNASEMLHEKPGHALTVLLVTNGGINEVIMHNDYMPDEDSLRMRPDIDRRSTRFNIILCNMHDHGDSYDIRLYEYNNLYTYTVSLKTL